MGGNGVTNKPLVMLGLVIASLFVFLLVTSKLIFLKSYEKLEEREVEQNVERALSVLSNSIAQLNTVVGDYAGWDDSCRFIQDGNQAFIKANLVNETYTKLRLNLIIFVTPTGKTVFEKWVDLKSGGTMAPHPDLHSHLSGNSPLVRHVTTDSVKSGVLLLPEGPLIVVSRPILTSEYEGPVRGALIMGRFLDKTEIKRLAQIAHLSTRFFLVDDQSLPPDVRAVSSATKGNERVRIWRLNSDTVAGYSLIRDINGAPAMIMKVEMPRNVYRQGVTTISYYFLSVMGVGILSAVIGFTLYSKLALSRKKQWQSEARYHAVIKQASDGIMLVDAAGKRVLETNNAMTGLLGFSETELNGMTLYDISDRDRTEIDRDIAHIIAQRHYYMGERNFRRKDGSVVIVEASVNMISGDEGDLLCMVVRDITARKRNEEELRRSRDELEIRVVQRTAELSRTIEVLQQETAERLQAIEALREKDRLLLQQSRQAAMGEMIGNIAHQWRQPLNALGIIVQSLPIAYSDGELDREHLEGMEATAMQIISHMSQTIDDFRNYFKPDKEKVPFTVNQAVAKTLSLIEESFRNQQITIVVEALDDPVVHGYPNEYAQVLLNILINARDALLERKTVEPKVAITMRKENEKAVVIIADNGGGIPEDSLDKIFDPYFTTKGPDKGTGVGLFMSKGIIEKNMGGKLTARNTGEGAEFRIEV